jgi:predicted DNA-binding transcriptional regulator AlpA
VSGIAQGRWETNVARWRRGYNPPSPYVGGDISSRKRGLIYNIRYASLLPAHSCIGGLTQRRSDRSVEAVPRRPRDPSDSRIPDEDLREALRCHAEACGYRWRAKVQVIADSPADRRSAPRIVLKLTVDDAITLAGLIRAATDRHNAAQDKWVGTVDVARELNVTTSTIRSWLARGLPRENPFPRPRKILGRSRWRMSEIDTWRAAGGNRGQQADDG